jgi:hypothetical protein
VKDLVAGELFLDEMTNSWAVIWVILIFLVMNVVLMNLLIAMMSNTCKPPSPRSSTLQQGPQQQGAREGEELMRQTCGVHAPSLRRPGAAYSIGA